MPAKDIYHDPCKQALIRDGWSVTHDPYFLRWGKKDLFIDLGAEKLIAAEKGEQRIAVEIKSFVGLSDVEDLKNALGQYILYQDLLARIDSERQLFLAVRDIVFQELFEDSSSLGKLLLENNRLKILTFDAQKEKIVKWIS
jgi:16S rRNA C1402 N4-methylase RsmH